MLTKFYKMHGIGNDYIYFDCFENKIENPASLSVKLSDRHFGIGGDGIILVCPSSVADAKMRIFNADGSEAQMCGNGIRCVGKFLYDFGKVGDKTEISVETKSGVKHLSLYLGKDGKVEAVKVNMGKAELSPKKIPVKMDGERVVSRPLSVGGKEYKITCVSMGNPHCVVFEDPDKTEIEKIGPLFENNPVFPERVNTEFIKVISRKELKMRVWERGSGETWACGTGTCASVVAAVLNGYADMGEDVLVHLRGGDLVINYTDEAVYMTGPAALAFIGEVEI